MGLLYNLGTTAAKLDFPTFGRFHVEGKEAVPPKGPLIVAANHRSNADPCYLAAAVPRELHFLGKRSLFKNPLFGNLLRAVNVHPTDRDGGDLQAIRTCVRLLNEDSVLAVFPEGTRSRTGLLDRGKAGVAYIASRTQAPILPVAITGTENIGSFFRIPLPLCSVHVRIGEPFSLPVIEGRPPKSLLEGMADMIMARVAALLPNESRGYYSIEAEAGRSSGQRPVR